MGIRMEEAKEYSLGGRVFHTLRDAILKGSYQEHDELREIPLAEELGVSRTPVREALRQLELEGLVTIIPNKGAYVTGITDKDVRDIYKIRSLLEGLCAGWATEHIQDTQIEELEEIIMLSEFRAQKEGADSQVDLDGKFHEVLYRASDSRILEHLLSDFHNYVQLARKASVKTENRLNKSIAEHKAILAAIKSRNKELAESLANKHILNVIDNLKKQDQQES